MGLAGTMQGENNCNLFLDEQCYLLVLLLLQLNHAFQLQPTVLVPTALQVID